jgi:hypothetical protein
MLRASRRFGFWFKIHPQLWLWLWLRFEFRFRFTFGFPLRLRIGYWPLTFHVLNVVEPLFKTVDAH